jgi:hypothetical protein
MLRFAVVGQSMVEDCRRVSMMYFQTQIGILLFTASLTPFLSIGSCIADPAQGPTKRSCALMTCVLGVEQKIVVVNV